MLVAKAFPGIVICTPSVFNFPAVTACLSLATVIGSSMTASYFQSIAIPGLLLAGCPVRLFPPEQPVNNTDKATSKVKNRVTTPRIPIETSLILEILDTNNPET